MTELMTPEMKAAVEALAKLIREDKRTEAYTAAANAYNTDGAIITKITEYNVHQTALAEEYAKPEREQALIDAIQGRIDTLYEEITNAESYQTFVRAKEEYDAMVKNVTDELEYAISGRRPCTHDCSTCHADCASKSADTDSAEK